MRANRHDPELSVYRSHAEPSLPLFEQVSKFAGERAEVEQPSILHGNTRASLEVPLPPVQSTAMTSPAKPFANSPHVREAGIVCPFGLPDDGCDYPLCAAPGSPWANDACMVAEAERLSNVTGMEGASKGAGLQGCGSAPQVCGGVQPQGQIPSPSASVTSLSSDTGDRPLTGALGRIKSAPSSAIQAHARRTDKQTSHDAAASVRNISRVQSIILNILATFGPLTDEAISAQYAVCSAWATNDYPRTSPSGLRSRRSDLCKPTKHRPALVEDSGHTAAISTGRQATVWKIVNGGKQ